MRNGLLVLLAVLLVAPLIGVGTTAVTANPAYKVTLRVIDASGNALTSATVEVFYQGGSKVVSGTTNTTGYFEFEVLSNGTYLVVVYKEFYILDYFAVSGADVSKTINLTTGYYKLNASSTPINVGFNMTLGDVSGVTYQGATTNVTVYVPAGSSVTLAFPKEKTEYYVYKYVLDKIKYDYSETTDNTLTLTMSTNREVTAYYTKTFAITLEYWILAILVVIIVVSLVVAWRAGAKTAKSMIEEYRERSRKFVRRK